MIAGWQKAWVAGLIAMLAGFLPLPGAARPIDAAQTCHAVTTADETYRALHRVPERWRCDASHFDVSAETVFLRFRLAPDGPVARSFVTQASPFKGIAIWTIDTAGTMRRAHFDKADVHHLINGPLMAAMLPTSALPPRMVVVRIDHPWKKNIVSQARLDTEIEGSGWDIDQVVIMAIVTGILIVPLVLNLALYGVLRRRYALWHVVMVAGMLLQNLLMTGFVHLLIEMGSSVEAALGVLCLAVLLASALKFLANFIEDDCLTPGMRRLVERAAILLFLVFIMATLPISPLQTYRLEIISVIFTINCTLVSVAIFNAWLRGSRVVYFLIVGWTPALALGFYRNASYLLPSAQPSDAPAVFQFTLALEVMASTLGIVFRLFEMRREAERSKVQALAMEKAANHDPLTGLLNRNLIEERFATLYKEGFRTMAVIDLDHFKAVNDSHGHIVGDAALRAVGLALSEDDQARAFRMGGEEFLLLIRGTNAAERAERARRAITARIAATVPGLDRLVTASMGLVAHDLSPPLSLDFNVLYGRCDELLYKAKGLGRNRTVRERAQDCSTGRGNCELPAHPQLRA